MSITRAFTTRRVKQSLIAAEAEGFPQRSNTVKGFGTIRNKISGPVELIHTTNMLSYNAPDIYPKSAASTSSTKSDDELSDTAPTNVSTPPTSPDVPSSSPRSMSPEPNHLSCYFTPPGQLPPPTKAEAPSIPERAPSHTKKSYDSLSRQRSTSRLSEQSSRTVSTKASFTFSRSSSSSTNTAVTSHSSFSAHHMPKMSSVSAASPPAPVAAPSPTRSSQWHKKEYSQSQHPFGPELAQVSEIAEEFGVKDRLNVLDVEAEEVAAKGLRKFSAEEYLCEIQQLYTIFFGEAKPATTVWI